jgi:large subunit ribosomal protein L25
MSNETTLVAVPRNRSGKGPNRDVRRHGKIPAVIYGGEQAPEMISLDVPQVVKAHASGKMLSRVYEVDVEGKKTRVLPREVQLDPVKDRPIHVDFMRIVAGAKVSLNIPVEFMRSDASPGIKRGGVLNIVRHDIELLVDADNIPDHIEADLSGLDINDSLHISAIALPSGTRPKITRDFTVATIVAPSSYASEVAEAAAAAAAATAAVPDDGAAPTAPTEGDKKPADTKEKK